MVAQSKPTPPIVSCSLLHAVSLLNTKALCPKFITLDYIQENNNSSNTAALTLETIMALYIRYTVWLIQAYSYSKQAS